MNRLRQKYENEIKNSMVEKFGYKSVMEIPNIDKIVINMGIGEAVSNSKVLDEAVAELALITGQTVSYTHLDVYKRQVQLLQDVLNVV